MKMPVLFYFDDHYGDETKLVICHKIRNIN
jgi:hypothetical protein